jgi:sugar lactone lactonase YvrE
VESERSRGDSYDRSARCGGLLRVGLKRTGVVALAVLLATTNFVGFPGVANAAARDVTTLVYVADTFNHLIRKIDPDGIVSTLAGSTAGFADDLVGVDAQFNAPTSLTVDSSGNVFVADQNNHRVRKITPSGVVSTVAGSGVSGAADGTRIAAETNSPDGIVVASNGTLYMTDTGNNRIRRILSDGRVDTIAGPRRDLSTDLAQQHSCCPYGRALNEAGKCSLHSRCEQPPHSARGEW